MAIKVTREYEESWRVDKNVRTLWIDLTNGPGRHATACVRQLNDTNIFSVALQVNDFVDFKWKRHCDDSDFFIEGDTFEDVAVKVETMMRCMEV